ncbi:efflux RND transporter permease subunit, partial [Bacillus sp. HC-TM]
MLSVISICFMTKTAIFGAIFAIVIIMLFLRNIRTTLISVVSIPLSLLIAVLVIKQMDITLNIMTIESSTTRPIATVIAPSV